MANERGLSPRRSYDDKYYTILEHYVHAFQMKPTVSNAKALASYIISMADTNREIADMINILFVKKTLTEDEKRMIVECKSEDEVKRIMPLILRNKPYIKEISLDEINVLLPKIETLLSEASRGSP